MGCGEKTSLILRRPKTVASSFSLRSEERRRGRGWWRKQRTCDQYSTNVRVWQVPLVGAHGVRPEEPRKIWRKSFYHEIHERRIRNTKDAKEREGRERVECRVSCLSRPFALRRRRFAVQMAYYHLKVPRQTPPAEVAETAAPPGARLRAPGEGGCDNAERCHQSEGGGGFRRGRGGTRPAEPG